VWTSLGLFPLYPGRAELLVVAPLFPSATIHRASGPTIAIRAPDADRAPYVRALRVDGKPQSKTWLPESFALRGGVLDYTMSERPDATWGIAPEDAPPSFHP
jgi:putative alpha-1,2-mannosidase